MTKTDDGDPRPEEIEQEHWVDREWAREAKAYLVRLKSYLGKQVSTGASVSIPVAGNRFLVSPRERGLILGVDDPQAEPVGEYDELIRHSIGMQVMLMAENDRFQKSDSLEKTSAQRRFDAMIEYGDLCAYEMHRSVSTLSKDGDLEGGKQMAEYRRRLVGVLEKAGKIAGVEDKAPDVEVIASPAYDPRAAARAKARALNTKKKRNGIFRLNEGNSMWSAVFYFLP